VFQKNIYFGFDMLIRFHEIKKTLFFYEHNQSNSLLDGVKRFGNSTAIAVFFLINRKIISERLSSAFLED